MSQSSVKSVCSSIAAFNRRDLDAALAHFHADVEWEPQTGVPVAGTYHGHDGVREFWQEWFDTMEDFQLDLEECVDVGSERVLAVTLVRGIGRGSGVPVQATLFQVFDYRDGKAYRARMFGSRSAALAAVGLQE